MVNLGICRRCPKCAVFSPAHVDDVGEKTTRSYVECLLGGAEMLGWDSELPDGCPYVLEHRLTDEALADLDEDEEEDDRDA